MAGDTRTRRFDGALLPSRVVSGIGCRAAIAEELDALGIRRLLLFCSPSLRRTTPFVGELERALSDRLVGIYGSVEAHVPETSLERALNYAAGLAPDAVLSIGGGASHDMAKAIALMLPSGRNIADFLAQFEPPATLRFAAVDVEPLAVLTMPSTLSAADVVGGGAITRAGNKVLFVNPKVTPVRVFLDGEVVGTTPRSILAASGMNALHHCLEAYYSNGHQPFTDALAIAALERLLYVLPTLAPSVPPPGVEVFQSAVEAAAMSGLAYTNAGLGIGHAICHSLGGRYGLSHALANAVVARHSLRFNFDAALPRLAELARATGATFPPGQEECAAGHLLATIEWLSDRLGMPKTLREIGLPSGEFERIAEDVLADPQSFWNPRPVTREGIVELLSRAW